MTTKLLSWSDMPMSSMARQRAIFGKEERKRPSKRADRIAKGKEIAKNSPWGVTLHTFTNPNLAKIGGHVVRRKTSGGPWHLKHWGDLLVSESIEELFLQVIERIDSVRHRNKTTGPSHLYSFSTGQKRNRFGTHPESDGKGSITYYPGTRYGRLPSEIFFSH